MYDSRNVIWRQHVLTRATLQWPWWERQMGSLVPRGGGRGTHNTAAVAADCVRATHSIFLKMIGLTCPFAPVRCCYVFVMFSCWEKHTVRRIDCAAGTSGRYVFPGI
eukprot:gene15504-biopygen20190